MTKKVVTNDGKKGGWLVGKRHYDKDSKPLGGIKAVVTDAGGKPVELEGGEVIINREASKKYWKELSRINQSAGNGVAIEPPSEAFDEDPSEDYEKGGKIEFNANHIPNKWILNFAIKIKAEHKDVWDLGGNIFGNQAFINLKRVAERGYWLDSEEWMYKKWRSYVARHQGDFRIEGVVAMLKWVDKVEKGWQYMKNLIEEEIKKRESRKSKKMNDGGGISNTNAEKFMQWFIEWYKPISDSINITFSLPNELLPFKEKNAVILDLFEKKDQNIDAKKYLHKIVKKADELGVVIYLEPKPRHKYFINNEAKKKKITPEYLVDYYKIFGFNVTPNKKFMKRLPQMNNGGNLSKTPALASERIKGSKTNPKGTAKDAKSGAEIKFDDKTIASIQSLIDEHNEKHPSKKITLGVAKAVVRRGMGAYSGSHRPTIRGGKPNSRTAWGLARLKAFIYKAQNGKSKSGRYTQDDDLLAELGINVSKYAKGGLIAPNGKPSNLTPEQYKLVRTPEFKQWFGDWENDPKNASKVIDENGEPKVMYRGNPQEQVDLGHTFNLGYNFLNKKTKNNFGFFFTDNLDIAHRYMKVSKWGEIQGGSVTQVFLNIKNLFDLTPLDLFTDGETFSNYLVSSGLKTKGYKELIKRISEYRYYEHKEQANVYGFFDKFPSLNTFFIYNKIDGIVFKEMSRAKFPYSTYVVFNSKQIKLADGTNTTFNENNPDIRFAVGGGIGKQKEIPVRVDYLEQQLFENNKDIQVPKSVYKEYSKSGKVPKDIVDNLSSEIDEKHWVETTPLSVHLTPLNKMAKGGLIAPNGKPSNLTPEQYDLVRTPEFKAWFGDWENDPQNSSKVVDENAEPLVVYRGDSSASKKGFVFKTGFNRMSYISKDRLPNQYFHYFVDNYEVALGYGKNQIEDHNEKVAETGKGKLWEAKVTPYFLNIKNPIDITPNNSLFPTFSQYEKLEEKIQGKERFKQQKYRNGYDYGFYITEADLNKILENKLGKDYLENTKETAELYSRVDEWAKESFRKSYYPEKTFAYFIEYKGSNSRSDILRRIYLKMLKNNVDGMVFLESTNWETDFFENWRKYESGELKYDSKRWVEKPKVFAALESNQIKLADGSNTTFDASNQDIRYDDGGNINFGKVSSASSRFRPSETIVFDPPLLGPNGNKLISYTWKYEWTTDFSIRTGDAIEKRVSDWSQAELSADTGRNIVHSFTIVKPNGESLSVSSESVPIVMGFVSKEQKKDFSNLATASKTLAKQQMQLSILEAQQKEFEEIKQSIIDAGYPEIEIKPWYSDDQVKLVMGDGSAVADANNPYEKERIEFLKESYVRGELAKLGIDWYRSNNSYQISELKKRIERQKRKVENITETSKMEDGGNVDAKDSVTIDIPLMIRLLELSREDIKSDAELHFVVENLLKLKNKPVLTMDDYAFIADVEHNHLKKYDLGGKMPEAERTVDLGFGGLGNGTTVWDRNRIHNNDYKIVAHISNEGKITYYDKKLPEYAINQIESMAENDKKRYEDMNGLSTGYDFNPIQTPLN